MAMPTCPHCKHEFDADEIWHRAGGCNFPTERDGDEEDFECPSCTALLYVRLDLLPEWAFINSDGDEL